MGLDVFNSFITPFSTSAFCCQGDSFAGNRPKKRDSDFQMSLGVYGVYICGFWCSLGFQMPEATACPLTPNSHARTRNHKPNGKFDIHLSQGLSNSSSRQP